VQRFAEHDRERFAFEHMRPPQEAQQESNLSIG
jgi:hypothetical protein